VKILFVCQYFPPESNAPAVRTYEHARAWAAGGHDVTVLTGYPHHPHGVVPPEYRGEVTRRERVDGIDVLRTWVYATANRGVVRRSVSYGSFMASATTLGRLRLRRPDVVVGTTPQFLTAAAAYLLARSLGAPFVLELRDIWPESAVELGALRSGVLVRPLLALQRHLYGNAAGVITVSEAFRPHLHQGGVPDERIAYVPHAVDPAVLAAPSAPRAQVRRELGLGDEFVVSYVGTHGMAHGLDRVLEAAALLAHDSAIQFVFVGDGAERLALETRAANLQLRNVHFLGQQSRDRALAISRACDAALVPLRDLPMFRKVMPSKIFELMGSGIPIVCAVPEGEATALVRRSGGGVTVPPEDAAALAAALRALSRDPAACASFARAGRDFVLEHHLRDRTAESMLAALRRFAGAAPAPVHQHVTA
jgi:colanic acid biosynthesis glycosyl transferase WcaI